MTYIQHGTPAFRKTTRALFAGGFVTFAILYSTQPLMPEFTREFGISPTLSSLSLSVSTIAMAAFMIIVGSLSEAWGRKPVMSISLLLSSLLAILTAFAPNFHMLLLFRVLLGIVLAGLPAIAMAYLSEEIQPTSLGLAMGLYISGNSIGGMGGRIITGMVTDFFSWRTALATIGVISLVSALLFWLTLPPSKNFQPRPLQFRKMTGSLVSHLQDPGLLCLYGIGFLLMGSFVSLYNYIGFQLIAPPYHLSQTLVGWIFVVYIVGTFSSTWMGRLADQYGRRKVLWIGIAIMLSGGLLTLTTLLWLKIFGIAVFTFGFFGAHSIASSWVGRRAVHDRAQASSLYLFFYYVGSSIGGTAGGSFWSHFGWGGVISMIAAFLLLAFVLSVRLSFLAPIATAEQK
ncbi:MAG: MFS transporter [Tumebacillaceae bacterium]